MADSLLAASFKIPFSVYSIFPFVTGILIILIGLFVFNYKKTALLNRVFLSLCVSVFLWTLGYAIMYAATDDVTALLAAKIGFIGVVFIPTTTLHFVLEFLNKKQSKLLFAAAYIFSFLLIPVVLSDSFFTGMQSFFWGYYPRAGFFYIYFVLFYVCTFIVCITFLLMGLLEGRQKNAGSRHNQIKFVFLAFFIASFSAVDYIANFGIAVYPFAYVCAFGWIATMSYAITRHKLMDIDVILRRTLIFAGLMAFVFGVFSFATFLMKDVLGKFLGENSVALNAISIFLIVLGYDPIRKFLVAKTDQFLFQKKYDYQKLLKDASKGMSNIESLEHLLSLVVHFITMRMRIHNCGILSQDKESNEFRLECDRGFAKEFYEYHLSHENELIRYLSQENEAIEIEKVKEYIEAGNKKVIKGKAPVLYDFEAIKRTMDELETACCVPSFLGKELKNVLLLGEKKSGDYYVEADLDVLYTLAQESAIAIENARLYDEAIKKTTELEDINSQLEYAKNLLMKALKDTEVANKQLQDTQSQLIHEQKMATLGRLAASVGHEVNNPLTILSMNVSRVLLKLRKNPDLKVTEIMDTFDKMEQNIGRIKAVVNTLTGLLKKSEKGKFEPLSLKLILEETLPLVQFQTYLDNLTGTEVDFEVPGNLPLIRGDLERLQEVFLNLFINAYHAMEGKQHRRIRVYTEVDPADADMVIVHFQDNGKGMTDEIRKKIFNYRFTTKAPGKGSGLGLYMCKYIIELHGGDMNVTSKVGEGTTFIIRLPTAEKEVQPEEQQKAQEELRKKLEEDKRAAAAEEQMMSREEGRESA